MHLLAHHQGRIQTFGGKGWVKKLDHLVLSTVTALLASRASRFNPLPIPAAAP